MRPLLIVLATLVIAWALWGRGADPVPSPEQVVDVEGQEKPLRGPLLRATGVSRPLAAQRVTQPRQSRLDPWLRRERAPPDPAETGDLRLTVELVSEQGGGAVETKLVLWRIREPGNAHYTDGDRRIGEAVSKGGRAQFTGLAAGTYRIHARGLRRGGEDPLSFAVGAGDEHVRFELPMPGRLPVYLKVYDETGRLLRSGWKRSLGGHYRGSGYLGRPNWVNSRRHRGGWQFFPRSGSGTIGVSSFPGRTGRRAEPQREPVTAGPAGFELSRALERTREKRRWIARWEMGYEKHGRIEVTTEAPSTHQNTCVAPAISLRALQETVFLPDGSLAADAGAEFQVVSKAAPVPENGEEPDWRDMPTDIVVRLKGYRRLLPIHRLKDPLPRMVMEKR